MIMEEILKQQRVDFQAAFCSLYTWLWRLSFFNLDKEQILKQRLVHFHWMPALKHIFLFQLSSLQDGIYALRKGNMRSAPSLRRFPSVPFRTVAMLVWLTLALSPPFKEDRSSSASFSGTSLLLAISSVMPLALFPQVLSEVPQHFTFFRVAINTLDMGAFTAASLSSLSSLSALSSLSSLASLSALSNLSALSSLSAVQSICYV